jgi:hypothetical protein
MFGLVVFHDKELFHNGSGHSSMLHKDEEREEEEMSLLCN